MGKDIARAPLSRKIRRIKGQAILGIVAVSTVCLMTVGIGLFLLLLVLGGGRQVSNATDSGSLNVAKQLAKDVYVELGVDGPGESTTLDEKREEVLNFSDLVKDDGNKVRLSNINRIVAYAELAASNYRFLHEVMDAFGNTPPANGTFGTGVTRATDFLIAQARVRQKEDAEHVLLACRRVSLRLRKKLLAAQGQSQAAFAQTGMANSLRYLGSPAQDNIAQTDYQVAYVDGGFAVDGSGLTNVAIDPESLVLDPHNGLVVYPGDGERPNLAGTTGPAGKVSQEPIDQNQRNFLKGYENLPVFADDDEPASPLLKGDFHLQGVPVHPLRQPYLIPQAKARARLAPQNVDSNTPANAFLLRAKATDRHGRANQCAAASLVGVLDKTEYACIPNGFIKVENLPGVPVTFSARLAGFTGQSGDVLTAAEWFKYKAIEGYLQNSWIYGGNQAPVVIESNELPNNTNEAGEIFKLTGVRMVRSFGTNPPGVPETPGHPSFSQQSYRFSSSNQVRYTDAASISRLIHYVSATVTGQVPGNVQIYGGMTFAATFERSMRDRIKQIMRQMIPNLKPEDVPTPSYPPDLPMPANPDAYDKALDGLNQPLELGDVYYIHADYSTTPPHFKMSKLGDLPPNLIEAVNKMQGRMASVGSCYAGAAYGVFHNDDETRLQNEVVNPTFELTAAQRPFANPADNLFAQETPELHVKFNNVQFNLYGNFTVPVQEIAHVAARDSMSLQVGSGRLGYLGKLEFHQQPGGRTVLSELLPPPPPPPVP